jgi:hypothetical protein
MINVYIICMYGNIMMKLPLLFNSCVVANKENTVANIKTSAW